MAFWTSEGDEQADPAEWLANLSAQGGDGEGGEVVEFPAAGDGQQ